MLFFRSYLNPSKLAIKSASIFKEAWSNYHQRKKEDIEVMAGHENDQFDITDDPNDETYLPDDSIFVEELVTELKSQGLHEYCNNKGIHGNEGHIVSATTATKRVARAIVWTARFSENNEKLESPNTAIEWFEETIMTCPEIYNKYFASLLNEDQLSPSTILGYLGNIRKAAEWLVIMIKKRYRLPRRFEIFMEGNSEYYNKKKKVVLGLKSSKQHQIDINKWPEHGMEQLKQIVLSQECKAKSILREAKQFGSITKSNFNLYKRHLASFIYTSAPQGRVGAITDLTVGDAMQLLEEGMIFLQFKRCYSQLHIFYRCVPVKQI